MDSGRATLHNLGWFEERKVLEPEAGCLDFPMTEHPRLDDLIRFSDPSADDGDRVFEGDFVDWRIEKSANEF